MPWAQCLITDIEKSMSKFLDFVQMIFSADIFVYFNKYCIFDQLPRWLKWIKALATRTEDVSLISGTHVVEGEN